jgi:hypothetical protein
MIYNGTVEKKKVEIYKGQHQGFRRNNNSYIA